MTKEEKEQTGKYVLQMARLLEDGCYQQEMLLKAVRIIDEALEQEPKSEWQKDHEILKAYSDGANEVLEKIRAEIDKALSDGIIHKKTVLGIIDKCKAESEDNE